MEFEWDAAKARLNSRKHGVSFPDAVSALEDDRALTMSEHAADGEERWITLGMDALGRVLVVIYTLRAERVRLISARTATPSERRTYVEGS
jgi:uncharacterized DUF497 family protein